MRSICATLCVGLMVLAGLVACSDEEEKSIPAHTEAEELWITQNQVYFQERKAAVEENGQLLYRQLVVEDDTLLYRVLEAGLPDSVPTIHSDAKVSILGILPVSKDQIVGDGKGNPIEMTLDLDSPELIKGLAALLLRSCKGERVETVIPYQLGYGEHNYPQPYIPLCSTLQFTITVKGFE